MQSGVCAWLIQTALYTAYEDDKGSERCKRVVDPDGTVRHYEGKARRAQSGVLRPCY